MKTKEYVIPCDKDIKQNAKITWSVLNLYIFSDIKGSSRDRATNLGHEYQKLIFIALLIAVMKIGRRIYDMNMIVPTTFISAVKFRNQQLRHFSDGYQQQKEIQILMPFDFELGWSQWNADEGFTHKGKLPLQPSTQDWPKIA